MNDVTLEVIDLRTWIGSGDDALRGVDGVTFSVSRGEIFGIAGESGSGKSMTALSILRLLPPSGRIVAGSLQFRGVELTTLSESEMRKLRGDRIAMIFQDPMSSLNPLFTVGHHIREAIAQHKRIGALEAKAEAIRLMRIVEIPSPESRFDSYPHEFSGGMRQRIMIAIALACSPDFLIADEPTTALDVTVERQIMAILQKLKTDMGTAILLISHNLNLLLENCDRIAIMYAGQIVEQATAHELFNNPQHPYTCGLLNSMPRAHISLRRLTPLAGLPPKIVGPSTGCRFAPRCPVVSARCSKTPDMIKTAPDHEVRCVLFANGAVDAG